VHVDELGVAAAQRQLHGVQRRGLGRLDVVGVIGVVALARDIDGTVLASVLVGDVVDHRTFRHREAGIVLRKHLAEVLHRRQELVRVELLIADDQDRVIDKGPVETRAQPIVERPAQIDAAHLDAGVG
jgi:hypothetical protein